MAGGFTRYRPEEDRPLMKRTQYNAMLATSMGGNVAEEPALGEMTTGPQNDIQQATHIARQMVTQWGMSERLGPRSFGRKEEMIFLGREISEQRDYSEKVAEEIDEEVRRLIDKAHQTAKDLLTEYRAKLDEIVAHILIEETLDGDRLTKLLDSPVGELPLPTTDSKREQQKKEEPPADEPEKEDEPKTPPVKGEPGLAYGSQSNIQTESDS